MKNICNIISYIAAFAFVLSIYSIESLSVIPLITMFLSGTWLVAYGMIREEQRRIREGR